MYSYGLNRQTPGDKYFTAAQLIRLLLRCVSNGGNLLLDVGPHSDGTIPTIMQDRLLSMGDWLAINGDAVYGSRQWRVHQEGTIDNTTVRYTQSSDNSTVYAFVLAWPEHAMQDLPSVDGSGGKGVVTLLGGDSTTLQWVVSKGGTGITVTLPHLMGTELAVQPVWTLKLVGFA